MRIFNNDKRAVSVKVWEMVNAEKLKQVGEYFIGFIKCSILFVLVVGIYCFVFDGRMFWDIFLPAGQWYEWNDEVFYYKQIESIIKYGIPRGYFGYNESHAQILTYGPWSIFLLLPYAIVGKVLGWNYFMPVLANIMMFASAVYIYAKVSGATLKERILTYCIFGAFGIILRCILSGMVEPVVFSICIVIISLTYKLAKNPIDHNKYSIWILLFLCFAATVMRPYYVVLFSYPVFFSAVRKKGVEIIGSCMSVIISVFAYFKANKYLCAPYFMPIIDLSFINSTRENGILTGIYVAAGRIGEGLATIKNNLFMDGQSGLEGRLYLFFLIELILLILLFVQGIKKKQVRTIQAVRGITIGIFFAMLAAVLVFYTAGAGARHILMCLVIGAIVLMWGADKGFSYGAVLTICIFVFIFRPGDYIKEIPYRTEAWDNMIIESKDVLHQCIEIDLCTEDFWDNTVAYEAGVPYNDLYGLPAGIGIQFDFADYLLDAEAPVRSKYLMVVPGGDVSRCLKDLDAELLGHTERFEVFLNPGVPLYRIE